MISLFLALLLMPFGFLFLWKAPTLRSLQGFQQVLKISVVIPARNEEDNLPTLLMSLLESRSLPFEIIVVDDASTDRTAEIADQLGAKVIKISQKPKKWNGKSWALWQGAQAASGDFLLFLDADTKVHSDFMDQLSSQYAKEPGFYALQPSHVPGPGVEQLSAFLNVLVVGGLGPFGLFETPSKTSGAFGPAQFVSRDDYFKAGGHEAIAQVAVEDLALPEIFQKIDIPTKLFVGGQALEFRMYPQGWKQMQMGFKKSFATGASHTSPFKLIYSILWISAGFTALANLLYTFRGWPLGLLVYLLFALQFRFLSKQVGRFSPWVWLFYPLPLSYFLYIHTLSFLGTRVFKNNEWKGRAMETSS